MSGTTSNRESAILGVGRYVPPQIRDNGFWEGVAFIKDRELRRKHDFLEQVEAEAEPRDELAALQLRLMNQYNQDPFRGSRERRVAADGVHATDLEEQAARRALDDAGIAPEAVDMILINSCPSDDYLPHNGTELQHRLGCGSIAVLGIDTACTSFVSMLMLADSIIRGGGATNILVITSAMFTRLTERDDPMSITLGDGAGAAVVGPARGQGRQLMHMQRGLGEFRRAVCCAPRDDRPWYEGHGRLIGRSRDVALGRVAIMKTTRIMYDVMTSLLAQTGLSAADVTHFFAHQGAASFNQMVASSCGLEHARTKDTFARYGSVGAANIPINIAEYREQEPIPSGSVIFMFSIGMGLNYSACLLVWD